MKSCFIAISLSLLSASSAFAQQADPPSYQPLVAHITTPDGSHFQVLDASGSFDAAASSQAAAAYVAATPQPQPGGSTTVTKLGFIRLMTSTERAAFIAAQAQANALTPAQMTSPTPAQQALMGLQVFLMEYNALQPGDTINLTDPDTGAAVNLFLTLGILPSQARVTAILAGQAPSS